MKLIKAVLLSVALLVVTVPGIAQAGGGHGGHGGRGGHSGHRGGVGWGLGVATLFVAAPVIAASYYARPYYPPSYIYPPNYVYAPTYVEPVYAQQYQVPAQQQTNAWLFCPSSNAYYPYVRQCPGGWQQISPTPPGN